MPQPRKPNYRGLWITMWASLAVAAVLGVYVIAVVWWPRR